MSEAGLLASIVGLFPRFVDLVSMWLAGGKDPEEELDKLMSTADVAADVAEALKFGE
jgi:hypothetical protein